MNKLLSFLIFVFIAISNLQAQKIEIGGGLNRNQYYTFFNSGYSENKYITGYAFSIHSSYEDTINSKLWKFLVLFENYRGKINTLDWMAGGGSGTKAYLDKYTIGFGVCPFNLKIIKVVSINFGFTTCILLRQKMIGTHFWSFPGGGGEDLLQENPSKYTSYVTAGLTSRIAYEIKINQNWSVVPQYLVFFGILKEVRNIEANPKSFRQTIAIGLSKKLTKK